MRDYKTRFGVDGKNFEDLVSIAKNANKRTLYDIIKKELTKIIVHHLKLSLHRWLILIIL